MPSAVNHDIIVGSEFNYIIDTTHGLSSDGYIATGTESIVYKGIKTSKDGKIRLSCVLKFKYKAIRVGAEEGSTKDINLFDKFMNHDLKIFDELQDCRSVVRIFDVIEDLGDFSVTDTHVPVGKKSISINREQFFCVVEEYVDGWSLEEYCRDEYWKLTETVDIGNNLKNRKSFHDFSEEKKAAMLHSYLHDYDEIVRYQSEMLNTMMNLAEILRYITDEKKILHLDIKPDNIMVTKYGKEIVLIDFGRSEHIDSEARCVQSTLGVADYGQEETHARMYQYGTLGYAAPECFAEPAGESEFPLAANKVHLGEMTVESDIFSFGATFWECLSVFELYTGNTDFATDKRLGGSYEFYRKYILNDKAYCDRDLSVTSKHYHEKLERIIKKCTHQRKKGYLDRDSEVYSEYYHNYEELLDDIRLAKESAPALVKTENIKVRNAFGVAGVMAGLLATILLVCLALKVSGSYFAQRKMDTIMSNYNPTLIERLEDAAIEQMMTSTEGEKHDIFNRTFKFLEDQDNNLEYSETVVLVDLLKLAGDSRFVGDSVNSILLKVDQKGLSSCVENVVTKLPDCSSVGYELAVNINNAQKRMNLSECYSVLVKYADSEYFSRLTQRLARDLNHEALITKIAEDAMPDTLKSIDKNSKEYTNAIAEIKYEIKSTIDSVIEGNRDETD